MKDDYLNENEGEETLGCEQMSARDKKIEIKKLQDSFLDCYSFYMHEKTELHKSILKRKAMEIELLDPNFTFIIE